MISLLNFLNGESIPYFILGGGSNVLFPDGDFEGVIIRLKTSDLRLQTGGEIVVDAGVLLSKVVTFALQNNLSGMEWGVGIPGTIGGAVRGNAGAMGKENSNCLVKVKIWRDGEIFELEKDKCEFGYRESVFKNNRDIILLLIITTCCFILVDYLFNNTEKFTNETDLDAMIFDESNVVNPLPTTNLTTVQQDSIKQLEQERIKQLEMDKIKQLEDERERLLQDQELQKMEQEKIKQTNTINVSNLDQNTKIAVKYYESLLNELSEKKLLSIEDINNITIKLQTNLLTIEEVINSLEKLKKEGKLNKKIKDDNIYNELDPEMGKPIGSGIDSWKNDYVILDTDKWTVPMTKPPVCVNTAPCKVCPVESSPYVSLKSWDDSRYVSNTSINKKWTDNQLES